jgi:hypothetical protein
LEGARWSATLFLASDRADDLRRNRARAEDLVAAGRGRDLFEMDCSIGPALLTAKRCLDTYCAEHFNLAGCVQGIRTPMRRLDAGLDTGTTKAMTVGVIDDIERLAPDAQHRAVVIPRPTTARPAGKNPPLRRLSAGSAICRYTNLQRGDRHCAGRGRLGAALNVTPPCRRRRS